MTFKQAARRCRVSVSTISRLARKGHLKTQKVNRAFVIVGMTPEDVQAVVTTHIKKHGWTKRTSAEVAKARRAKTAPTRIAGLMLWLSFPDATRQLLAQIGERFTVEELELILAL